VVLGELLGLGRGHADSGEQLLPLTGELGNAAHHLDGARGRGLLLDAPKLLQHPTERFLTLCVL
jgi:hypothetical protein